MSKRRSKKRKKSSLTAKTADKHLLYQEAVQNPDFEIKQINKVFRRIRKRKPLSLREDFCGTGLLSTEWTKSSKAHTALGLDIDASVLKWGIEKHVKPLVPDTQKRIKLIEKNVIHPPKKRFDVIAALNYSYFVFQTRDVLRQYFKGCLQTLKSDGLLLLDAYGGSEAQEEVQEERDCGEFTYVWDQDGFDPIQSTVRNYIHFGFEDGSEMRRAFTYEWRLWQLIEIRELLREAGFRETEILWEGFDKNGEGSSIFRKTEKAENSAGWNAYIVGIK